MPFITDPMEKETELVDYILENHTKNDTTKSNALLTEDEMRQFIYSTNHDISMTEKAQKLLTDYFVASRRVRPGCLPVGALRYISSLSQAHARLNLRKETVVEDVVAIISLYEESMQNIFGLANIAPPYIKSIDNINEVIT